eukprot:2501576-Rhodomonas_salina.3
MASDMEVTRKIVCADAVSEVSTGDDGGGWGPRGGGGGWVRGRGAAATALDLARSSEPRSAAGGGEGGGV